MIEFKDSVFVETNMQVGEDYDVKGAFVFFTQSHNATTTFILSAHDRVRLIELLGGTDANSN